MHQHEVTISFLPLQTHESEAGVGTQNHQNSNATCFRAEQQQPFSAPNSDFHTCGYPHAEQVTGNAHPPCERREIGILIYVDLGLHSKATLHLE